jgi:hypothetical protein
MSNENIDKYAIYDWAVDIKGKEEVEQFLQDPKGFLSKIGALDRSPDFNGFVNANGEKIEPSDIRQEIEGRGDVKTIRVAHYGIPYDYPLYCSILV